MSASRSDYREAARAWLIEHVFPEYYVDGRPELTNILAAFAARVAGEGRTAHDDEMAALRAERDALAKLWRYLAESFFDEECGEIDESAFYDACVEAGLMEPVPYDPEIHGDRLAGEFDVEKGDMITFVTALGQRLRGESSESVSTDATSNYTAPPSANLPEHAEMVIGGAAPERGGLGDEEAGELLWRTYFNARYGLQFPPVPPLSKEEWASTWNGSLRGMEREAWIEAAKAFRAALASPPARPETSGKMPA